MFEKAKIGDEVWDFLYKKGTVVEKENEKLFVKFNEYVFPDNIRVYNLEGKLIGTNYPQTLFWDELKYETPKKPFNLEKALRMLEETDFDEENYNYYIFYNVTGNKIDYDSTSYRKYLGIKFFTKESILKFFEEIEFKKISEKEFFDAYNKVFGGK